MTTKEPATKHLLNKIRRLKRKYNISQELFNARIAEHTAQLKALTSELRNRNRKYENKQINKQFKENPRQVYRNMTEDPIIVDTPPEKEKLEQFWRPLFETPQEHKENEWINDIIEINKNEPEMTMPYITEEDIEFKLKSFSNFKKPGVDKIPNFWLKELTGFHHHYARIFDQIVHDNIATPKWLTTGTTSLLPKSKETSLPNKYRPITCLPTTYKLLTGLISDAIYQHLDSENYLEEEQKGFRKEGKAPNTSFSSTTQSLKTVSDEPET